MALQSHRTISSDHRTNNGVRPTGFDDCISHLRLGMVATTPAMEKKGWHVTLTVAVALLMRVGRVTLPTAA